MDEEGVTFHDLLCQAEKHEVAPTLFECGHHMESEFYWSEVGEQWERSESHYRQMFFWERLLVGKTLHGEHSTDLQYLLCGDSCDVEWLETARKKGERIDIWRGGQMGWSWTTEKITAEWFAERSAREGEAILFRSSIHPADIIARRTGRGENEVIVNPDKIGDHERWTWPCSNPPITQFGQMIQSYGSAALCGGPYNEGRNRALLLLDPDSGKPRPDMHEQTVEYVRKLILCAAKYGAATIHLRLSEFMRGLIDGEAQAKRLATG